MCVCTGHGALHRLIPPCVLWCCLCMLCSVRSILVPNPYLRTSCSGNSKVPHLSPQDRGSSQLLHLFPPTQTFWETTLLLSSPSFSAASQGLWICMCSSHTFSFCPECESFRACGRKDKAAVGVLLCWEMLLCQAFDEKIIAGLTDGCWIPRPVTRASHVLQYPSLFLQDQKGTA